MKWPLFENKIKGELSGHRSEVDIDALWSAIEPEVDAINKSKRKRRFGIIWFLFAGVLLLGSGAAFYFLNNNEVNESTAISENNLNEKIKDREELGLNSSSNAGTNSNAAIKTTADNNNETIDENENKTNHADELIAAPKNNTGLKTNNKPIDENKTIIESKKTTTNNQQGEPIANTKSINNNDQKLNPTNLPVAPSLETTTISDNNETPNKNRFYGPIQKIGILELPLFKINTKTPQVRIPPLKSVLSGTAPTAALPDDKRHPMGKKAFRFSIGTNGGLSYANRNLSVADSTGNGLINLREKTEKQLETTHLGLQLNLRHKSGFEIGSGLQYTRMVERFDYFENITELDSIDGILYYAVNPNNDTLEVMGMVPHKTITDIRKRYYNRYTMFDVPVLVGYFKENDNWSYGAQAGVFANISLKTEGRFLKTETEDEDIKDLFKSSVGLSYYLGISAVYKLDDNFEIGISPYFRYFPKNFAIDSYPISQKYTLFGLDAKFRYWF